ncbi:hypothetical protein J7K05_00725 [bacterium]|nr:hypothetical protein [bacterium]
MAVLDRAVIVAGRRILAGDKRVLINNLVIFEKGSKGWHFDPSGWLLAGEAGVTSDELWHILTHPPFNFPLDSCWDNKKCSEDKCCKIPPGLTEKEFTSFLEAGYDWDLFDFRTYMVRPRKGEDGYCIFHNSEGGCQLFGSPLRPQQCRWRYCWDDVLDNGPDLSRYILSWYPPAPSDRVRQRYNLR